MANKDIYYIVTRQLHSVLLIVNRLEAEVSTGYTLQSRSNLTFLIFDIRALWRSRLSARVPECQKLKM